MLPSVTITGVAGTPLQSGVAGLPEWAPLLIAPIGALGFLLYWYLFLRED